MVTSRLEPKSGESVSELHERRRLQREWWKRLVAHPDARLHSHIAPGELVMFGISDADQACLIRLGLSLNYTVWCNQCEISLHIDDRSDPHPEHPLAMRRQNAWEKAAYDALIANKDQIEASFGEGLHWCERGLISSHIDGGYTSPEPEWDNVVSRQVSAMNSLHATLLSHVTSILG